MIGAMTSPNDLAARRKRLGELVAQARVALHFRRMEDAAAACGLAPMTYRNIEAGQSVRRQTYVKLEAGFGMVGGSVQAVLDGADSITLKDGTELVVGAQIVRSPDVAADLSEELRQTVMDIATMVSPHIPGGEAQEISRRAAQAAIETLRKRGLLREDE